MTAVRKAADIPDSVVIEIVQACNDGRCDGDMDWGWHGGRPGYGYDPSVPARSHWTYTRDIAKALEKQGYKVPPKIVAAKLSKMLRRGLLEGCDCGCRGDWEIPGHPLRFPVASNRDKP